MRRRGVILPTVLFMLLLLGLLCAMFAFRINANLAATQAMAYRMQARLAAEAGIERVKLLVREAPWDMSRWYHNPDELNRIIVWAFDTDATVWGTYEELDEGAMAYRFSIVADDPTDDEEYVRFGITDESSKVNLNQADEEQLLVLVRKAVGDDEEIIPREIVAAILDWRDEDQVSRSEEGDTEDEYYLNLDEPYPVKNGPFDTVEELLLVKGVTGQILYGEDIDRNGLLTDNEDDGEESFPPDNEDNSLNRGLYPYLTVHSYESNVSNENRPRIYLLGEAESVRAELSKVFEDEPGLVDYIVSATRSQGSGQGGGQKGPKGGGDQGGGKEGGPGGADSTGKPGEEGGPADLTGGSSTDKEEGLDSRKAGPRQQYGEEGSEAGLEEEEPGEGEEEPTDEELGEPEEGEFADEGAGEETDDAGSQLGPIRTPAELLRGQIVDGDPSPSPLGIEHLAVLMDCTTVEPPEKQRLPGLININTAPAPVLRCLRELTGEQIEGILETRGSLDAEEKATTAWLVTEEVVDLETYIAVAPKITARGQQFMIESLGYGDHIGMVVRLQVVVDLVGPVAQTIYSRYLTYLGGHFPIREEDRENIRVE